MGFGCNPPSDTTRSRESALHRGPVSTAYLTSLRGLPATLERLRIDCQLAEAMATGFDPLHLAEVFGISEHTAIRQAVNGALLGRPVGQPPGSRQPPLDAGESRRSLELRQTAQIGIVAACRN